MATTGRLETVNSQRLDWWESPLRLVGERKHLLYPLSPETIDYIESAGNYVTYHVGKAEYIARESIKRLETVLAPVGFFRIERSLLLNVRAISFAELIGRGTFAFTLFSGARLRSGQGYRDRILVVLPLRRRPPTREGRSSRHEAVRLVEEADSSMA